MNGGTLSGGVVIALAAVLWLAYLVPTWLRRRDYLNSERNAVRLQQTLRILAETAEMPEEVRVEATAREVARQQKLLKKAQARADAAARASVASDASRVAETLVTESTRTVSAEHVEALRAADTAPIDVAVVRAELESQTSQSAQDEAGRTPATGEPRRESRKTAPSPSRVEHDRVFLRAVRRTRLATTGVVLAALVGLGFGVYSVATADSWWVLLASAALLVCAFAVLRRLAVQVAAHNAARRARAVAARQAPEPYDHAPTVQAENPQQERAWQPQPLPKPMYQSPGSRAATAMASLDAAVALRRAAAKAELDQRAARLAAADVPQLPGPGARQPVRGEQPSTLGSAAEGGADPALERPAAPPSRYARMGVVDDVEAQGIDLDEALRRRRAVS